MATIHVTAITEDYVYVRFGMKADDGTYFDGRRVLKPGEKLFGLSFDDLARRGVGPVEVEENN